MSFHSRNAITKASVYSTNELNLIMRASATAVSMAVQCFKYPRHSAMISYTVLKISWLTTSITAPA